jgi:hypothetical protein
MTCLIALIALMTCLIARDRPDDILIALMTCPRRW